MAVLKICDNCGETLSPDTNATHGITIQDKGLGEIRVNASAKGHVCSTCLCTAVAGAGETKVLPIRRAG